MSGERLQPLRVMPRETPVLGRHLAALPGFLRDLMNGTAWRWQATNLTATALTLDKAHHVILSDATAGAVTLTLPDAASVEGKVFVIKKVDATANTVTIAAAGTDLIDGVATKVIAAQYAFLRLFSKNTAAGAGAWWLI